MRSGTVTETEAWVRCPFCGDSKSDPEKAHFSINLRKYLYHCYRCHASGRLTLKQTFQFAAQLGDEILNLGRPMPTEDDPDEDLPELSPGPGSHRDSALDRYHFKDDTDITWDAFYMKYPKENVPSGVHLRYAKRSMSIGDRGFGWGGSDPLLSTPDQPLRLVEGPYDTLAPTDVCVFGLITASHLTDLAGHSVVLCPDGDVWQDDQLFHRFKLLLKRALSIPRFAYVVGLEYLPDGKDPDEVPLAERLFVSRSHIREFVHTVANMHGG